MCLATMASVYVQHGQMCYYFSVNNCVVYLLDYFVVCVLG